MAARIITYLISAALFLSFCGGVAMIVIPYTALDADPGALHAVNSRQTWAQPQLLKYFRCARPSEPPVAVVGNETEDGGPSVARVLVSRAGESVAQALCEGGKRPHVFLSAGAGAATLVGVLTLIMCMCLRRPEPDFVLAVPLVLAIVVVHDILQFNAAVPALITDCTAYDVSQGDLVHKLNRIVVWSNQLERWGVNTEGAAVCASASSCNAGLADNIILCSRYYDCSMSGVPCGSIVINQIVDRSLGYVQEDKALLRIQGSALAWTVASLVNLVGMVLLTFSSLVVRVFPSNIKVKYEEAGEEAWLSAGKP